VNPATSLKLPGTSDTLKIWAKKLNDGSIAVIRFIRVNTPASLSLDTASLDISSQRLQAHDLWAQLPVDLLKGIDASTAPTHGVVMLTVLGCSRMNSSLDYRFAIDFDEGHRWLAWLKWTCRF